VAELADFLDLTAGQARQQFRELRRRSPVSSGRQVTFLPVETLLCLAASFLVNHRRFGGSTAHQAPEPVPTSARLFSRPPSSVLAKMANLDGSRSHRGKWDILAGAMLREDSARFTDIYRLLLRAARAKASAATACPISSTWRTAASLPSWARTSWTRRYSRTPCGIRLPAAPPRVIGQSEIPNGSSWPRPA
jgi:putative restriction endonuclease